VWSSISSGSLSQPERELRKRDPLSDVAAFGWWLQRLRILIYIACAAAFLFDILTSDTLAFGVIYIPMVCTALLDKTGRLVWWLCGIAIVMIALGTFLPDVNPNIVDLIGNRALSVVAILITGTLVSYAARIRECLAEQTRRAENAERAKTAIFANIGYDLRSPLHAVIGLAQVMHLDCRPNQREPLAQVQDASRRLLATINNLVDLSRFEERIPRADSVDLRSVVQSAVDDASSQAANRDIALVTDIGQAPQPLTGDSWATRRIVENILDNAVRFSPTGGVVKVSMASSSTAVAVTVTDTGSGLPEDVLSVMARPQPGTASELEGVGTGLALCHRLAEAIGAELLFESDPDIGTSATVRFSTAA
jgi:signal transduction histidine kinase